VPLLAIRILIASRAHNSLWPFIYYLQLLSTALRTNLEVVANGAVNFLLLLSIGKATIILALHAVENCAKNAFRSVAENLRVSPFNYDLSLSPLSVRSISLTVPLSSGLI
jgi:hypothetical protein